ncbi:hypothetical protein SAMN05444171_6330 [Bradyrhizobium lablabi]|uniref:Uncharacterized protein n=2 Tax=Bradyrhizobium TaxID=374 RepID=A0ABY0PCS3_9BRAD|nr:hypothetical protein SAMN05444163_0842 [Bradyrhizobium ottawaense]SEE12200.1 hypothetical protein SAMN05444171_6330 [Bradyrhizobium lablabi]SHM08193.1 hypothetical protein SAMN05444321_5131 [Bradyrhizobium lablabi]
MPVNGSFAPEGAVQSANWGLGNVGFASFWFAELEHILSKHLIHSRHCSACCSAYSH